MKASDYKVSKLLSILLGVTVSPMVALADSTASIVNNPLESTPLSGWQEEPGTLCQGYYVHQQWDDTPLLWKVTANDIDLIQIGESKLLGEVHISYGQRHLYAEQITIAREHDRLSEVVVSENLTYEDPDLKITGSGARWHAESGRLNIDHPYYFYFPKNARGKASMITVDGDRILTLKKASYTTCSPTKTSWELKTRRLKLNPNTGLGDASGIQLNLHDIPVFYWPYLQIPIDNKRHSGFLFPTFGTTTQSGIEVSWPFYWNIAPQYDATLTPRMLKNRGLELQTEVRYLTTKSEGDFHFHILPNDQRYQEFRRVNRLSPPIMATHFDPRLTGLDQGTHRYGFQSKHHGQLSPAWSFDIDYTYVGDDNYFYDLENDLNVANTTKLNQEFSVQYQGDQWTHVFRAQSHQLLHPLLGPINKEEYKRLPQWAFEGYYPDLATLFAFQLKGETTHFVQATDPMIGLKATEGIRYYLKPGFSIPLESASAFFKPRIQTDILYDDVSLGAPELTFSRKSNPKRLIPIYDVDTGLYFDKFTKHFQQTLEPRLYYLYVPYSDQSDFPVFDSSLLDFSYYAMFRDNRFSGHDRLQDTHQTTVALTSRILNRNAQEKFKITVGEIFYFKERQVSLCPTNDFSCRELEDPTRDHSHSPLIGQISYTPTRAWSFTSGVEWNTYEAHADKSYLTTYYAPHSNYAIQLNYYWMRRDPLQNLNLLKSKPLHQADLAFMLPVHRNWELLTHYRYDFENQRPIEILGGLEYNSCCFALQVLGNRFLRPNDGLSKPEYANSVFVQVLFKGLSTLGSGGADNKLQRTIPFYQPFAKRGKQL